MLIRLWILEWKPNDGIVKPRPRQSVEIAIQSAGARVSVCLYVSFTEIRVKHLIYFLLSGIIPICEKMPAANQPWWEKECLQQPPSSRIILIDLSSPKPIITRPTMSCFIKASFDLKFDESNSTIIGGWVRLHSVIDCVQTRMIKISRFVTCYLIEELI